MIGAMTEEFARRCVDPISAAAEINAVQVKLENLVFAKLPLKREGQDAFLDLAHEVAVVGQEDVARELLRDGRGSAYPVTSREGGSDRSADVDRVDANMATEAAVLGRDHRRPHLRRDMVVAQPLTEARAHRHQNLAVGSADSDHLAEVGPLGQV